MVYFDRTAVSYTGSEEVEQYRLELRVTVSMDRTADNEYIIRNETISEWILYDPPRNPSIPPGRGWFPRYPLR